MVTVAVQERRAQLGEDLLSVGGDVPFKVSRKSVLLLTISLVSPNFHLRF